MIRRRRPPHRPDARPAAPCRTLAAPLLGLAIAAGAASALPPAHAAEFALRAVTLAPEGDEDRAALRAFEDAVETASDGAIEVEVFAGTAPCETGPACLEALAEGSIDVYVGTVAGAAVAHPELGVLALPHALVDDRTADAVLAGNLARELRRRILAASGDRIRLGAIGATGDWRHLATVDGPVAAPGDLAGATLATDAAGEPAALVRALGATPETVPWPALPEHLATGDVEGLWTTLDEALRRRLPEAGLRHATLDGERYPAALWFVNEASFGAMPESLRGAVLAGLRAGRLEGLAASARAAAAARSRFVEAGGTVRSLSTAERLAFRAASAPVREAFAEAVEDGDRWLELLDEEVERALAAAAAADEVDLR